MDECRSVPHAWISSVHRLVERSSRSRTSRVRGGRGGGSHFRSVRVSLNAGWHDCTIRYNNTLDTCPGVGVDRVDRCVRAPLLKRRQAMARVDRCGSAYVGADSQFRSLAEYQLPETHCLAPHSISGGTGISPSRRAESLDAGGSNQLAPASNLCGRCNDHRVAARQSQAGAGGWRQHCIARRPGKCASGRDDVGNPGDTANGEFVLFNPRGRDGLRVELRSHSRRSG